MIRQINTIIPGALLALSLTLTAALPAHAQSPAGDASAGKAKALTCMGCHGNAGMRNAYPGYLIPKIGGQHPEYIVAALQSYKNGTRNHETMRAQAASLSEQDMADIAAWLTSLGADK